MPQLVKRGKKSSSCNNIPITLPDDDTPTLVEFYEGNWNKNAQLNYVQSDDSDGQFLYDLLVLHLIFGPIDIAR